MSTSISDANAAKLNKMRKAAQNINLGTFLQTIETAVEANTAAQITSGSIAVTSVHTNASAVTIATGLGTVTGYQIYPHDSSGSGIGTLPYVNNSSGSLIVMARSAVLDVSGSFALTTGDIYNWIAW